MLAINVGALLRGAIDSSGVEGVTDTQTDGSASTGASGLFTERIGCFIGQVLYVAFIFCRIVKTGTKQVELPCNGSCIGNAVWIVGADGVKSLSVKSK